MRWPPQRSARAHLAAAGRLPGYDCWRLRVRSEGEVGFCPHLALEKQCPFALHRALEGEDAASPSPQAAVEAPLPACARLGGRTPARHRLSQTPPPRLGRHLRPPLGAAPNAHRLFGPFPHSGRAGPSPNFV